MNKEILAPKKAEEIQNEIYRKMSPEKKLEMAFQLIVLAKKLKTAKEIKTKSQSR